ncbi:response regulator transcription factor [Actinomadura bangladeshensis]|uniref:response regulator transcription factor n=1 Tax=Actinomadura bangladeshensis TaxID=453573 RepID=UPI0030B8509F
MTFLLEKGLGAAEFGTVVATDGVPAYEQARGGASDLIVLDCGLPLRDGSTVRRLREERVALPIIILTARGSVADTVAALEGGADDYNDELFSFEELLVGVWLRADRIPEPTLPWVGDLALDSRTQRAQVLGRTVELISREFTLGRDVLPQSRPGAGAGAAAGARVRFSFDPGSNVVDVSVRYL